MGRSGSRELTAPRVAWDAWRATRGGSAAVATRQAARLEALVQHARRASRFYAEHYLAVSSGPIGLEAFTLAVYTEPVAFDGQHFVGIRDVDAVALSGNGHPMLTHRAA